MNVKRVLNRATQLSPLYAPLRDAYQRTFNRVYWQHRQHLMSLFSRFISSNDLVFDVGANVGEYTRVFAALGARVVAVEPNPNLVTNLKLVRPFGQISVEGVALGSKVGTADLYLCGQDYLATLSPEWIRSATQSRRFAGIDWNQQMSVPMSTLDMLITKYGMPTFIKIDVEGFEKEVLAGLSTAPKFLSFEFNSEFVGAVAECVSARCFGANTEYNLIPNPNREFMFETWVGQDEFLRLLETLSLERAYTYGDIFARVNH